MLVMEAKNVLFVIFFQKMMTTTVLNAVEEPSETSNSRSALFVSRENTRLKGHVIKQFETPSLMSCSQSCVSEAWCTSTNFRAYSNKDGKGNCELNKHERSVMNEDDKLQSQQGFTFSAFLKGCRMYSKFCHNGGSCLFNEKKETFSCSCKQPWGGESCQLQTACIPESVPLGMEDGSIPDSKITVSSSHHTSEATWGRLHYTLGSWTPNTDTGYQWFQVDFLPEVKLITHIATQGNGKTWWWVMTYYVMYRAGGVTLQEYKENNEKVIFQGNTNKDDVVKNKIGNPFEADTVRIIPMAYSVRIALRIELYGCDDIQ